MTKQNNDLAVVIVFILLSIMAFLSWLIIQIIHIARIFFWISLVLIPIAFVTSIIFFIKHLKNEDYDGDDWIPALISLGLVVLFFFSARISYDMGYSEEALQTELEAREYLEWYNKIIDLFKIPEQATNQAIEETINNLCKEPTYPCDEMKQGYQAYVEIKGFKDVADIFSKFLLIDNKKN